MTAGVSGHEGSGALTGRHILVTREEDGENSLTASLTGAGASVRKLAFTRTEPPEDTAPLVRAIEQLSGFDWVVLTSARAVKALSLYNAAERIAFVAGSDGTAGFENTVGSGSTAGSEGSAGVEPRPLWACVGPATAAALEHLLGVSPNLIPDQFDAETLAQAIQRCSGPVSGRLRVLFPAADNAKPDLPARLRAAGMEVTQVTAYRTVAAPPAFEDLVPPSGAARWDGVVFTSGLVVQLFHDVLLSAMNPDMAAAWLENNRPMALGRSAEAALEHRGAAPVLCASRPVLAEFARTIIRNLSGC